MLKMAADLATVDGLLERGFVANAVTPFAPSSARCKMWGCVSADVLDCLRDDTNKLHLDMVSFMLIKL